MKSAKTRELSYDFLKGIAVFTMVVTHVVAFFHDFSDPVLDALANIGGTVSFAVFLFCAGAVLPYFLLKEEKVDEKKTQGYFWRTMLILGSYYLLAILATWPQLKGHFVEGLFNILVLGYLPKFIEFIPTFVIFALLVLAFKKELFWLKSRPLHAIGVSVGLYLVGTILWSLKLEFLPELFKTWSAILWGYKNWHSFPILQFTSVLLLGINFGYVISGLEVGQKKALSLRFKATFTRFVICLFLIFLFVSVGLIYTQDLGQINEFFLFSKDRFPPSPRFILIGLVFLFGVLSLYWEILRLQSKLKLGAVKSYDISFAKALIFMGSYVFQFFFWHTVLLYLISYKLFFSIDYWWQGLLFTGVLLLGCTLLILLTNFLSRAVSAVEFTRKK